MSPKDQEVLLKQFREELTQENLLHEGDSIGTDDRTLLRFLRARQWNLKNAKIMWKNCHDWRKNAEGVGIDELYRRIDPFDYPERDHVFQFWPLFFHKTDKRGRPINIHHFGRINTTQLYKHITPERFWQAFLVNAESLTREILPASASAAGKPIDGTFVIVDLKGFGTGQFWQMKNLARGAFQVSQDYFPETMSQLAIVNAPTSFTAIWSVMRPWLAKETVAKVSIHGSNYKDTLLDLIDEESLPLSLGGKCTCSDCGPNAEEKGASTGMGACAFSSAGPWLAGRKQRREAWLKGEREIALRPGELQQLSENVNEEKVENTPKAEEITEKTAALSLTTDREGNKLPRSAEASSKESSPGPSTPADSFHESILTSEKVEARKPISQEESIREVYENHPETRTVIAGDLHA